MRIRKTLLTLIPVLCIGCAQTRTSDDVINVIFDTDIGNDIDDTESLALFHHYMDEGRVNLLGICLNKEGEKTARFVDIINTFYGHSGIPMARARNNGGDGAPVEECYTGKVCDMTAEDGSPLFPTTGIDYDNLPDGHILYRKLLAAQPDNSVTIISVGFLTNLARLLDTPADEYSPLTGMELVRKKVKELSIMAGRFSETIPEFNVVYNIPAAQKIFNEWPGKIVCLPWELVLDIRYPAESIENDFNWIDAHPLKEAYIRWCEMPLDNMMFDPTAVVYGVEGGDMFTSSGPGTVHVDDNGVTTFSSDPKGMHSYMKVTDEQAQAVKAYFVDYLTRKPACKQ